MSVREDPIWRTTEELDWRVMANCRGMDPELFFPVRGEDTRPIKAICAECIVRTDCLDFALAMGEKHGIWGGKAERERVRIRKGLERERRVGIVGKGKREKPILFAQPRPGTPDYLAMYAKRWKEARG
jgi:WhiB family redox-sensing transcriptional regulator